MILFQILKSWLLATIVAVVALGSASSRASILLPEAPVFDEAELVAQFSSEARSSSGTGDGSFVPNNGQQQSDRDLLLILAAKLFCAHTLTGYSGSTTSTSATGPTLSGSAPFLMISAPAISGDGDLVERLAGERSLSLPDPAGAEILKPPR